MTIFLSSLPKPNMSFFTMYMGIAVAVCIIAAIIAVRVWMKFAALPVKTVSVKLIGKKKLPASHLAFALCLQFLTDDDELIEILADSELQFECYHIGDTGELTCKGSKMIKFERTHVNPQT